MGVNAENSLMWLVTRNAYLYWSVYMVKFVFTWVKTKVCVGIRGWSRSAEHPEYQDTPSMVQYYTKDEDHLHLIRFSL